FEISATATSESGINWWYIGGWLHVAVTALLLILMIHRLTRILLLPGIRSNGYNLSSINGSSFSFFNKICIDQLLEPETREMVLKHEKVHADQWHSADALYFEILSSIFWSNPAIWHLKKELRDTHEFIADRKMKEFFPQNEY